MQGMLFEDLPRFSAIPSGKAFYDTDEWRRLRYLAIRESAGRCQCCGTRPSAINPLQADHIKPRSLYPWLALDPDNIQILCRDCNLGKGNIDCTDWREYDA